MTITKMSVSGEFLRDFLRLPHGAKIVDAKWDDGTGTIEFAVAHSDPSPEQREIIRHSLGLTTRADVKKPYRNHYCDRTDSPKMEELVRLGWMREGMTLNDGRDRYYIVTEAGAKAVGSYLPLDLL